MTATLTLTAPLDGWCMPLADTPDPVFSAEMLGTGLAIDPTSAQVLAPFAGEIVAAPASGHAVSLRNAAGVEVLIHIGIDTVALAGRGFERHVSSGQRVGAGERLITIDLDQVALRARSLVTPIVLTDLAGHTISFRHATGSVRAGDVLLTLTPNGDADPITAAHSAVAAKSGAAVQRQARLQISLAHGLHARPAALIAQSLKGIEAEVELSVGSRRANARSVVAMMSLGVKRGDELSVVARGREAEEGLKALERSLEQAHRHELSAPDEGTKKGAPHAPAPTSAVGSVGAGSTLVGQVAVRGFAVGRATRIARAEVAVAEAGQGVAREAAELDRARAVVDSRLSRLAGLHTGPSSEIVSAHREILFDPVLDTAARRAIEAGGSAGFAWRAAVRESIAALAALEDQRLRQRIDDLRDIETQVLMELRGTALSLVEPLPEGAIVMAEELMPSQLVALDRSRLQAVCLGAGGVTSHVAILAAAMNVPMLVGLGPSLAKIADGATVVVDAERGRLELEPDAQTLVSARNRLERRASRASALLEAAQREGRTADRTRIEVFANVGSEADARAAVTNGAEGCGLLRTEFLFLDRSEAPDEEEQLTAYQAVADALGSRPMVLRLLDVGGDKPLSYLPLPPEENPALGLRGIRTGLARRDLLCTQLRAALRVRGDRVRLLVPMVTDVSELREVRALARAIADELGRSSRLQIGAMIETPAAAVTTRQLATEADFLSVGSNDLSQYTLAMDRGHAALGQRIDALHPAVLSLIGLAASRAPGCPIAVCGAMAADAFAVPLLLGLGVTELSVVPARVPHTKAILTRLTISECAELAQAALALSDAGAVREQVRGWLERRGLLPGEE